MPDQPDPPDEAVQQPAERPVIPPPSTEAEIRAARVNGQPSAGPIILVEYSPEWPRLFEREAARIRATLGERVRLIEHAGSTSVQGLAAKPIIDIVLAVPDSSDEPSYVPAMEAAGYVLRIREPHWFEHRVFKGPDTDVNLHVFTEGCSEIDKMLLFRDWLRTHPDDRERYLQTKRTLAAKEWTFVQNYADAKSEIVETIVSRARATAARTGGSA